MLLLTQCDLLWRPLWNPGLTRVADAISSQSQCTAASYTASFAPGTLDRPRGRHIPPFLISLCCSWLPVLCSSHPCSEPCIVSWDSRWRNRWRNFNSRTPSWAAATRFLQMQASRVAAVLTSLLPNSQSNGCSHASAESRESNSS